MHSVKEWSSFGCGLRACIHCSSLFKIKNLCTAVPQTARPSGAGQHLCCGLLHACIHCSSLSLPLTTHYCHTHFLLHRRLGHLAWVSIFAVAGFMFTSGIVLYQGGKVATERHDFMDGEVLCLQSVKGPQSDLNLHLLTHGCIACVFQPHTYCIHTQTHTQTDTHSLSHYHTGVDLFQFNLKALYAIPIVVFGFNCHANVSPFVVTACC